jgi:hypothetical protein
VRRYTPHRARALLESTGLELTAWGGLYHSLLVPRMARKLYEYCSPRQPPPHAGEWRASAPWNAAVLLALRADVRLSLLLSRIACDLPGLSWWALCRKRAP